MTTTRFFMQQDRFHIALSGTSTVVCVRAQSGVLAETRLEQASSRTALLATDGGDSVVGVKSQAQAESVTYNAYGFHNPNDIPAQRPAFNGHLLAGFLYLLGNGYRGYNPVLMRFQSPDSLTPFSVGGLNCYVYCEGDSVNFSDPSGHMMRARSRSPRGRRLSSTTEDQIVLDVLNSQPGWDAAGGSKRSMSPATVDRIVQDALNTQPGWIAFGAPTQTGRQSGQALSPAEALRLLGEGAGQVTPSVLEAILVRSGNNKHKPITDSEYKLLLMKNAVNARTFSRFDLNETQRLRLITIVSHANGLDVSAALREARPDIQMKEIDDIQRGVRSSLASIRRSR
jgi:RHS repeat-associated protein